MILIWTVSPFITSYIIGNMFDILEKEMMRDYYFLTIVLFGINMFSIYIVIILVRQSRQSGVARATCPG